MKSDRARELLKGRRTLDAEGLKAACRIAELLSLKIGEIQEAA